jgi:hypothetical protein
MVTRLSAEYLVVGAGAAGMAFTDALVDHADVQVVIVDRRHAPGGHWLDAYPFVRLHQASSFYGVASSLLGEGRVQQDGPEAGLHERASAPEVCSYYARVMERMVRTGKVSFYPGCDYVGAGRFVSRVSGQAFEVDVRRSVVDAHYLSPRIPADTPPPFEAAEDAAVLRVDELVHLAGAPSRFVIVGSGKTATDTCIWLLDNGVDPDAICWVRPRDPWMINRAVVQPDPAVFLGMAADVEQAAVGAASADEMFLRLEDAGVMLRIEPSVIPTMAKVPTLARWELDRLRTITDVVRLGHLHRVEQGRLQLTDGDVAVPDDTVVVHAAAAGIEVRPLVPIWRQGAITPQPVRAGFPCFGAALVGYVEATVDDDRDKNLLCPPSPYSNTPTQWARMQALGYRASLAFMSDPDLRGWANTVGLNPARIPPDAPRTPALAAALQRLQAHAEAGMTRMAQLADLDAPLPAR